MLTKTLTYTNFNDEEKTKRLYFNISKTDLADNLHLAAELESMERRLFNDGETRELTTEEITEMLNLVKVFVKMSYGIRSDDGESFTKSAAIWDDFTNTAAYDALLMDLFSEPNEAVNFLIGIMPADLREEARNVARSQGIDVENPGSPTDVAPPILGETISLETETLTDISGRKSDEEIMRIAASSESHTLTHEELQRAFQIRSQQG